MITVQFYQNPHNDGDYSHSISTYGSSRECTPVGTHLQGGEIKVEGDMQDFFNCNYIGLTREGKTTYGWIENVKHHTSNSFIVEYATDPLRTYLDNLDLGEQFIARSPQVTYQEDGLLGTTKPRPTQGSKMIQFPNHDKRVFVVQIRQPDNRPFRRTPMQPSPYVLWFREYNLNSWTDDSVLVEFMEAVTGEAEPTNVVTMYSIPWVDLSGINAPVDFMRIHYDEEGDTKEITGFKRLPDEGEFSGDIADLLTNRVEIEFPFDPDEIMRTNHRVQVVIPEAGVMKVPDELVTSGGLFIQQDVDLYSGACNYMLWSGEVGYTSISVRGNSVSSIPILSDPMDTYLSQNQNALTTSMIGDVASMAVGAGLAVKTGGLSMLAGGGMMARGARGIAQTRANVKDSGNDHSNPTAMLGTALGANYNGHAWLVYSRTIPENEELVHNEFGYPYNMIDKLEIPGNGFIQTENCGVGSDGTVPRWAIEQINALFDAGIKFHD